MFFRIPNISLTLGLGITTYNLFRFIIVMAFIYSIFNTHKGYPKYLYLFAIYLVITSISSIFVVNINQYITGFTLLVFISILYLTYYYSFEEKEVVSILKILVFATAINISIQFILYFFEYLAFFKNLFSNLYIQFYEFNKQRGRFFGESYDEALVPIIYYLIHIEKSTLKKLFYFLLIILIIFVAFFSHWRTKIIILFLNLIFVLFYSLLHRSKIKWQVGGVLVLAIFFIPFLLSLFGSNNTTLQRFDSSSEQSIDTTLVRVSYWRESMVLIRSNLFTGVGLGNWYDNLSQSSRNSKKAYPSSQVSSSKNFIFINDPHNIFISIMVSSGAFALLALLILIYIGLRDMVSLLKLRSHTYKTFVGVSFWSLFLFSLFNPYMDFPYLSLAAILLALLSL